MHASKDTGYEQVGGTLLHSAGAAEHSNSGVAPGLWRRYNPPWALERIRGPFLCKNGTLLAKPSQYGDRMLERTQPSTVVIRFVGQIDASRRDDLIAILEPAAFAEVAVIDLSEATYLDSTALSCVATLRKNMNRCGSHGAIRIARASASARRLFTIAGFDEMVEFYDSVAAARATPTTAMATYALIYE
jgi:anti-anti-sigma factor